MISFVWSAKYPFVAGTGGSENYTAGQIRELQRRGIPCRILTLGHGENDGRADFPDIPFKALSSKEELAELDDIIVFVTYPLNVKTKHRSYVILHCPPLSCGKPDPLFDFEGIAGKQLITPSKFAGKMWSSHLGKFFRIPAAHPFAEPVFGKVKRPERTSNKVKILFAGRLTPDKGIYTLLASLHMQEMLGMDYELTATTACSHAEEGQVVKKILEAHPWVNLVPSRNTPQEMAGLMAEHDIVVMPSTDIFWKEAFGIVSVEAQHAGCRVVASRAGGIPETDCGSLVLVKPDDPQALAKGVAKAVAMGPVSASQRAKAATKFTVQASVDKLLNIIQTDLTKQEVYLHLKKSPLMGKQFELTPQLSKLGARLTRDKEFAYDKVRPAGN